MISQMFDNISMLPGDFLVVQIILVLQHVPIKFIHLIVKLNFFNQFAIILPIVSGEDNNCKKSLM